MQCMSIVLLFTHAKRVPNDYIQLEHETTDTYLFRHYGAVGWVLYGKKKKKKVVACIQNLDS